MIYDGYIYILTNKMYDTELRTIVFSIIKKDDPFRATKEIQLKNWCHAFLILFSSAGRNYLTFFLDVLSDENCWEQTNNIHRIKLNRRTVAKNMIEPQSWKGTPNPLDDISRFQVSCWCCVEEGIFDLFENLKKLYRIADDDKDSIKKLAKLLTTGSWSDPLTGFWSHVMGECAIDLPLEEKHPFEYGLHHALNMYRKHADIYAGYVEAVEFFWNRVKSLDEDELSCQQKYEVFMDTTVRAASHYCQPEIFDFCISQLSVDLYREFLKREISINQYYNSFSQLHKVLSFDRFQALFDSCHPDDISQDTYRVFLSILIVNTYSDYYRNEALKLFLHIWRMEGFETHRGFAVRKELCEGKERASMLLTLVKHHYMELVWPVLDEFNVHQISELMKSKEACCIRSALEFRRDTDSLNKFLSYHIPIGELNMQTIDQVNLFHAHADNYAQ